MTRDVPRVTAKGETNVCMIRCSIVRNGRTADFAYFIMLLCFTCAGAEKNSRAERTTFSFAVDRSGETCV